MKTKLAVSLCLLFLLSAMGLPVLAHHGGSEYDTKNLKTLAGTVTEFNWSNPHCQILVDVKGEDGKIVNWSVETLAPAVLKRAGWSPQTLHAGDQVTLIIAPSKHGTPVGMIRKLQLASGKTLTGGDLGEQGQANP